MSNFVSFFGLEFNIPSVAFHIGAKPVYWYGIIIALALISGWLVSSKIAKSDGLTKDNITDVVLYGAPTAIVFARLYYVAFSFSDYKDNLWEIFAIWNGGIAIYGAVIGAALAAYIYARIKKLDWKSVFDVSIIGVILGQCIGRWGNFFNKEAFGCETTLPWKMGLYEHGKLIYVHPTFLYESLWNLIGVFVLIYINRHKKFKGQTFYSYLVWYGIGRFFIEGLRTDSLYLGTFRVSQLLAMVTVIIGIILIIINYKKEKSQL